MSDETKAPASPDARTARDSSEYELGRTLDRFARSYESRMMHLLRQKQDRLAEIDALPLDRQATFAAERIGLVARIGEIHASLES